MSDAGSIIAASISVAAFAVTVGFFIATIITTRRRQRLMNVTDDVLTQYLAKFGVAPNPVVAALPPELQREYQMGRARAYELADRVQSQQDQRTSTGRRPSYAMNVHWNEDGTVEHVQHRYRLPSETRWSDFPPSFSGGESQ